MKIVNWKQFLKDISNYIYICQQKYSRKNQTMQEIGFDICPINFGPSLFLFYNIIDLLIFRFSRIRFILMAICVV